MAGGRPRIKYHCVSVIAGVHACAAAKAIKDQRILSAEAPRLPLPTCDMPADCRCVFRKFDDRRAGPRRAHEMGRLAQAWPNTDRRRKGSPGRRETDYD